MPESHLPYPIFGPEEIGTFQEIVHDLCVEKSAPREKIFGACEELEWLLVEMLQTYGSYLIEFNGRFIVRINRPMTPIITKLLDVSFEEDFVCFSLNFLSITREEGRRFYERQTARQKSAHVRILNQSLRKKNKEIERMLDSKKYLLNFLAHELRTPLTAIMSSIELMRLDPKSVQEFEIDKMLESSTRDMNRLVDEVLDMSKMENDSMTYEMLATPIKKICEDFVSYAQRLVLGKKLEWSVLGMDTVHDQSIKVDAFRLRQVLSNILTNSVKFTTEGKIQFAIAIKDQHVTFSIQDTGRGIKDEYKDSLFKEFTQESVNISRQFGGTGLGMTICYRLVNDMKGHIEFDSQEGIGTTFRVKFPLIS